MTANATLRKMKGIFERMLHKDLNDLFRGIRSNKDNEALLSFLKQLADCPKTAFYLLEKDEGELNASEIFACLFTIVDTKSLSSYACVYALEVVALLCKCKRATLVLVQLRTNYLFRLCKCLQETLDFLAKKRHSFRYLREINAILCTFLHAGYFKVGREAMKEVGVNHVIFTFMKNFFDQKINSKYTERIIMLCSLAIQRCLPPLQIPLASFNPYHFIFKRVQSEDMIPKDQSEHTSELIDEGILPDAAGKQEEYCDSEKKSKASTDSSEKSDYEFFSGSENSCNNSSSEESETEDIPEQSVDLTLYSEFFKELSLFPQSFVYEQESTVDDSSEEKKDNSFFRYFLHSSRSRRNSLKRQSESLGLQEFACAPVLDVDSVREDNENVSPGDTWFDVLSFVSLNKVKSVIPFVKIAECMQRDVRGVPQLEQLSLCENSLLNKLWFSKLVEHIEKRSYMANMNFDNVVYDIEKECNAENSLRFESRFENGNLRKVIRTGPTEYTLLLNTDVNTSSFGQWFFFEVKSMKKGVQYVFDIINCRKQRSLYREGVCPLLHSKKEYELNKVAWKRVGTDVTYYRNHYVDVNSVYCILHENPYYTLTFSITFPHDDDTCYLSYNYPYTYSMLLTHLHFWQRIVDNTDIYFDKQILCQTLAGNDLPILTITNRKKDNRPQYVFLLARVHPSESPASWNMKGCIDFLLSNSSEANKLRDNYVFKIVPMMNPDGVVNGNSRTSLSGDDLNRQWVRPDPFTHPTIFHTKMLLKYINSISKGSNPVFFCDFHGHSHRSNVFLYGCAPQLSWRKKDRTQASNDYSCFIVPLLLSELAPAFNINYCSFSMDKSKEGTARITVWREFGVKLSYTMECTQGGCDQGIYRSKHLGIEQLKEMGAHVCKLISQIQFKTVGGKPIPQMTETMRNHASA
ncbi:cytosolic carboxypeptidase 1-like isoform X1, partial [Dinothrombium tinctorium]